MDITLRKWRDSDAPSLACALSNVRILHNLRDGIPYPYTERDAAAYIAAMLAADENEIFARAIVVDGRAVGSIGAFRQENVHRRSAEVGYYLAEAYWGRGVMTEALRRFAAELFASSDLLRLYAEPFAFNRASCRVLEKAGFVCEGRMRDAAVKDGVVTDVLLYARVRGE